MSDVNWAPAGRAPAFATRGEVFCAYGTPICHDIVRCEAFVERQARVDDGFRQRRQWTTSNVEFRDSRIGV